MNENRLDGLKEERDLKSRDIAKHLKVNESTYSGW
jgi:DNA-binding XRE family transcriptional regulator